MKKIYYLQKHPVKLGDIIEYNGIRTTVTEELIELNPELFSVEDYTQPMYFKCVKGEGDYTKDRIYKQNYSTYYPTAISLISNKGVLEHLVYWQSAYIKQSRKCFELTTKEEWDKQNLLDDAKRRYPIGTVFNMPKHNGAEFQIEQKVINNNHKWWQGNSIIVDSHKNKGGETVYMNGEWAEILPLKFTTEDGVDIYGDMKTYFVHPNDSDDICSYHTIWKGNLSVGIVCKYFYHKENALAYIKKNKVKFLTEDDIKIYERMPTYRIPKKDLVLNKYSFDFWLGDNENYKYFFHRENALAYIEKHKEKTLEDYENMLLRTNIDSVNAREECLFYHTLKKKEPKLYYTKILQLIADDLNDGWEPDFTNYDEKWCISIKDIVHYVNLQIHGLVYFKESELAQKAKDILGEKIEYI